MTKAWSLLTLEDSERQFRGNTGYEDVLGRYYSWDETVRNDDKVQEGDLAVLRNKTHVLGLGWIDRIDKTTGDKKRYRCPHCGSTSFKERTSPRFADNKYKCANTRKCGKPFAEPVFDPSLKAITFYRADYSRTWQPLDVELMVRDIADAYLNNAKTDAIRELDFPLFRSIVLRAQNLGETWWTGASWWPDNDDEDTPDEDTAIKGGHKKRSGKVRVGQQQFRQAMLSRFKSSCAICGPLPGAVLDAAHLYEYARNPRHDPKGGLLLRRDLHALFDRQMLLIDPDEGWRVRLDPRLAEFPEVWKFEGQPLKLAPALLPRSVYLQKHAALARASWRCDATGDSAHS